MSRHGLIYAFKPDGHRLAVHHDVGHGIAAGAGDDQGNILSPEYSDWHGDPETGRVSMQDVEKLQILG